MRGAQGFWAQEACTEVLRDQITKVQEAAPGKPFAVNVPLLYPAVEEHMASIVQLGVPIVFTSAGNPKTWTSHLHEHGIKVIHVVSSVKFAVEGAGGGCGCGGGGGV